MSQTANPYGTSLFEVLSPAGSKYQLQTPEEQDWYERRRDRYQADNQFPNVSDLQDLDRLLMLEMLVHRWSTWLSQGFDYILARVDEKEMKNNIRDYSVEIRQLKLALGIDKATRDKVKGVSLADYVADLLHRAKEFGYHRNDQYELAVTKMYQLHSLVTTFDRCDEEERDLLDLSQESILDWIRENLIADWDATAEAFRKNQAIWIRQQ